MRLSIIRKGVLDSERVDKNSREGNEKVVSDRVEEKKRRRSSSTFSLEFLSNRPTKQRRQTLRSPNETRPFESYHSFEYLLEQLNAAVVEEEKLKISKAKRFSNLLDEAEERSKEINGTENKKQNNFLAESGSDTNAELASNLKEVVERKCGRNLNWKPIYPTDLKKKNRRFQFPEKKIASDFLPVEEEEFNGTENKKFNRTVNKKHNNINNFAEAGPDSNPELPPHLRELVERKGGRNLKLVIMKLIYATDLNKKNNRFQFPEKKIVSDFLSEEEKELLKQTHDQNKKRGMDVKIVIGPNLEEHNLQLREWPMKSTNNYVLVCGWNLAIYNAKKDNLIKELDTVQLWSFRCGDDDKLWFLLHKIS